MHFIIHKHKTNVNLIWTNNESIYYEERIKINAILGTRGSFKKQTITANTKAHRLAWRVYQPANQFSHLEFLSPVAGCWLTSFPKPQFILWLSPHRWMSKEDDMCRLWVFLIKTPCPGLSSPSTFPPSGNGKARTGTFQRPAWGQHTYPACLGLWWRRGHGVCLLYLLE